MFDYHRPLSAYLVRPSVNPRRQPSWNGFKTQFVEIKRYNPRLLQRSLVALAVWCAVVGSIQGFTSLTPTASKDGQANAGTAVANNAPAAPDVSAPLLLTANRASTLPSGPSGQLLPPGTMAPDRTYANSYARGQCTWYVASRRQIPSGWGNAKSWYYHASSRGWSVGKTPAVAAIAWTGAGYYGHVALVEQVSANGSQVYISEMNYRGIGVKSYRWVAASQFKYIY